METSTEIWALFGRGRWKECHMGTQQCPGEGAHPGLHIHLHRDSFRYIVKTNKKLHEAYTVTLVLDLLMHILSKYEKQILWCLQLFWQLEQIGELHFLSCFLKNFLKFIKVLRLISMKWYEYSSAYISLVLIIYEVIKAWKLGKQHE